MNPFSIAAQVQAIAAHTVQPAYTAEKTPREKRIDASRFERAEALRNGALRLLSDREDICIDDCLRNYPGTTAAQWPWILTTLEKRGHITRIPRKTRSLATRYAITDAGRKALEINQATNGAN